MKKLKQIAMVTVIGLTMIVQLMNPTLVHAEDEVTPEPTAEPTDVVATEAAASEVLSGMPSPIDATATPPVTATPDLAVTDTAILTPTAALLAASPTSMPSDTAPADSVTPTVNFGATATPIPSTDSPKVTAEPTEPAVTTINVAETPTSGEIATTEEPSLPEVLQELPADTNVVVLDENGQPLPLASQSTADIIAQADPIWCPDTVAPGGPGCTASYPTMADLLANEGTYIDSLAVNGTIWITTGNIGDTNPITFDGTTYTNWANYNLTLQGGWNGNNGDTSIGSNSIFSVPITITNWNNGVTITNIDAPSINLSNVKSTQGNGISVTDVNSDVNLDTIEVSKAMGTGLYVRTTGTITAENIISTENQIFTQNWPDSGTYLDGAEGITLTGGNIFSNNGGRGLIVFSHGNITLSNITANKNGGDGAVATSLFGAVTLTGSNSFIYNWGSGLEVGAPGSNITLDNTTTQHNRISGISVIYIDSLGLVQSAETVTLNNVIAQYNGTGLSLYIAETLNLSGGAFNNNEIGLYLSCLKNRPEYYLPGTPITNNTTNIVIAGECGSWIGWDAFSPATSSSSTFLKGQGELFTLDCTAARKRYVVRLANGDRGEIFCPVSGQASIDRVDNTTLPASLPAGYTYASAVEVTITKSDERVTVIKEGGHITASFVAQHSQLANNYSILYWDAEKDIWVPLKDFLLDQQGQPERFELYPGVDGDDRNIFSGVQLINTNDTPRVQVSVNFPGIFVLAQH